MLRSGQEITKMMEKLASQIPHLFYQRLYEILSWALDKERSAVRVRYLKLVKKIQDLPRGADGEPPMDSELRYELIALHWLLGHDEKSLDNLILKAKAT